MSEARLVNTGNVAEFTSYYMEKMFLRVTSVKFYGYSTLLCL